MDNQKPTSEGQTIQWEYINTVVDYVEICRNKQVHI